MDCGYALRAMNANRRKRPDIIDCVLYSCNNYARYGRSECTPHNIEARDLFNAVLADINRFADMAVNDERAVRAIEKRLMETDQSRAKALEKEQRKLNKRLAELDRLFSSLYEDKVMEREKMADGTVQQEIKIYYKFIGFVGELHITPTKRWTALKSKNCTVCGVEYVPGSAISKYCPACAKKNTGQPENLNIRRASF